MMLSRVLTPLVTDRGSFYKYHQHFTSSSLPDQTPAPIVPRAPADTISVRKIWINPGREEGGSPPAATARPPRAAAAAWWQKGEAASLSSYPRHRRNKG